MNRCRVMKRSLAQSIRFRLLVIVTAAILIFSLTAMSSFAAEVGNVKAERTTLDKQLTASSTVFSSVKTEEYVAEVIASEKKSIVLPDKSGKIKVSTPKVASVSVQAAATSTGKYPTRYGVILVTADKFKGIIPTGHAAIVWTSTKVVESLQNGVVTGSNNWNSTRKTCYGVTTYGTTLDEDNAASNWCYSKLGKPYNFNYFNTGTRSSFYCSQLVWAAFKDLYGIDMNTSAFNVPSVGNPVHPMELVNTSKTFTVYKK